MAARRSCLATLLVLLAIIGGQRPPAMAAEAPGTLRLLVMDPLALPLSCACVPGVGQKDYGRLAEALRRVSGRPVELCYAESLAAAYRREEQRFDLIIGQRSVVLQDAESTGTRVRPLLALTDRAGRQHVRGVVLVGLSHPAARLADLADQTLALGPEELQDCHAAVRDLWATAAEPAPPQFRAFDSVDAAVFALVDGEAVAAAVPEYLPPLLVGCQKVAPHSVRAIGRTRPVPFVQVFATDRLAAAEDETLRRSLLELSSEPGLRTALESQSGFAVIREQPETWEASSAGWTDWRGPNRAGQSSDVPRQLDAPLTPLWSARVTGPAMAGIAATATHVVVADKDADLTTDIFRCFDADSGVELWTLERPSPGELDYTNAPRATPVIHRGLVYLQGAWGNLHCVRLASGEVVWERHLATDFNAEPPTWGYSVPPLLVDDKLIVLPGGPEASIAALDARTGDVVWRTPGHAAAYAPLIVGSFGGQRQLVGYDSAGLGGWEIATGRRRWELVPRGQADFNVGTPVIMGDGILVATENNATRLYRFHPDGTINPTPAAVNEDLAPDTCTPVVVGEAVYCTAYGELYRLDGQLETEWSRPDDRFFDHSNLIAGNGRVLIWTTSGDLLLLDAEADEYRELAHLRPWEGPDVNSMSHPALAGDRLYLRDGSCLACFLLRVKAERP